MSRRRWSGTDTSPPCVTTAHLGGPCRVCGAPIPPRRPALLKAWAVLGLAHVRCGFWRPGEEKQS
jgi:hypothetical protein